MNRGMDVPEELRQLNYQCVLIRERMLDVARRADNYRDSDGRARVGEIQDLCTRAMRSTDDTGRWIFELRKIYG
jgi:hypothetical protein